MRDRRKNQAGAGRLEGGGEGAEGRGDGGGRGGTGGRRPGDWPRAALPAGCAIGRAAGLGDASPWAAKTRGNPAPRARAAPRGPARTVRRRPDVRPSACRRLDVAACRPEVDLVVPFDPIRAPQRAAVPCLDGAGYRPAVDLARQRRLNSAWSSPDRLTARPTRLPLALRAVFFRADVQHLPQIFNHAAYVPCRRAASRSASTAPGLLRPSGPCPPARPARPRGLAATSAQMRAPALRNAAGRFYPRIARASAWKPWRSPPLRPAQDPGGGAAGAGIAIAVPCRRRQPSTVR